MGNGWKAGVQKETPRSARGLASLRHKVQEFLLPLAAASRSLSANRRICQLDFVTAKRQNIVAVALSQCPRLRERLGADTPPALNALGNLDLLALPKTALFCSARCPGHVILPTYDQAAQWRDAGRCIISGFHSPVEKECLAILLRGSSPVIICPARALPQRIPTQWQQPLAAGRLLVLSGFAPETNRVSSNNAARRNVLVAALADAAYVAHATPGGRLERLCQQLRIWRVPVQSPGKRP